MNGQSNDMGQMASSSSPANDASPASSGESASRISIFKIIGIIGANAWRGSKPVSWLASVFFHAVLVVATGMSCSFGKSEKTDGVLNRSDVKCQTDLIWELYSAPKPEPKIEAPENATIPRAIDNKSFQELLHHTEFVPEVKVESKISLHDQSAGGGDGFASAGTSNDFSAGALGDLSTSTHNEIAWAKIKAKTIGSGATVHEDGTRQGKIASGKEEGGQGNGGIKGSGAGSGATDGTGTGASGVGLNPSNTITAARAVEIDGGRYPSRARRENRHGIVHVLVEVLEDGRTGRVKLKTSSGHSDLDEAALEAAKDWRFKPALRNGVPLRTWVEVPIRYALE